MNLAGIQGHSRERKQVQCQKQEQVLPAASNQGIGEGEIKVRWANKVPGLLEGFVVHNELSFILSQMQSHWEGLNRVLVCYLHLNRLTPAAILRSPQRDQQQPEGN